MADMVLLRKKQVSVCATTYINKRLAGQTTNPDKCDAAIRPACVYLMLAVVDLLWGFYQKW